MSEVKSEHLKLNALVGQYPSGTTLITSGSGVLRWVSPYEQYPSLDIITYLPTSHYEAAIREGRLKYIRKYVELWMEFCN